ncbi:MAG: CDP-diacylglycerol--serine O-phosphatidyltransferase [Candidatus Babeliales bacterium]
MVWSRKRHTHCNHPRHLRFYDALRRFKLRRGVRALPNILTLGNAFFGFCSIVATAQGDLFAGAYFILIGALMDGLDGRVARFAGVTSDLGLQLDSLCDGISFCLAPAFLVYYWQLHNLGFVGLVGASFFLLMGLLRLARFNITHDEQTVYFLGLPTTIAGCFLATLSLNMQSHIYSLGHAEIFFFVTLTLAMLMISKIYFPTFKHMRKSYYSWAFAMFLAFTIIMGLLKVLFVLFMLYFIFTFAECLRRRVF